MEPGVIRGTRPVRVTPVLAGPFRATPTYAAVVKRMQLAGVVYVVAPGVLILVSASTDSDFTYLAALVVALPLSLAANVASAVVAALILPSADSNGAPIAAVLMSGVALVQFMAVRAVLDRHRRSELRAALSLGGLQATKTLPTQL